MPSQDKHIIIFYKEELLRAKKDLFIGGTVKGIKYMQNRIEYLQDKISQLE